MTVHIPKTIEEAVEALDGVSRLLTAKEWERAAIVYAFTRDGSRGGDTSIPNNENALTPNAFAALGITGLKSDVTVRTYRKAWQSAIDAGKAEVVTPGVMVSEPDMDWPPTGKPRTAIGAGDDYVNADAATREKIVSRYLSSPSVIGERKAAVIAEALEDDYVAERVTEVIGSNPRLSARLEKVRRDRQGSESKPRQPAPAIDDWKDWTAAQQEDFDRKTIASVRHILKALFIRDQGYVSSGEAEMLLALIDKSDLDSELEELLKAGGAA